MDYEQVLRKLFSQRRFGIDLGLERVRGCVAALGIQPPRHTVQVAGTNGKGSTSAFIASALKEAGISHGVFSSPHLMSIRERFVINGEMISEEQLMDAYKVVCAVGDSLTFFETITVMAAWLFFKNQVEVAIYEVGLGGRLDSTTALHADISIVTGVGFDHQEYLGDSLEQIADEKAGVFRSGGVAIVGLSAPEAMRDRLMQRAEEAGSRCIQVDPARPLPPLSMVGEHQQENANAAACALEELGLRGLPLSAEAIQTGLSGAELSGRLQNISHNLWVDGAHNGQAAIALAGSLRDWQPPVLVIGLSTGKNASEFLRPLAKICKALVITQGTSDRALSTVCIAKAASGLGIAHLEVVKSPILALQRAQEIASPSDPIVVTGSLLLVGEILSHLQWGPVDPMWVSDPGPS